MKTFPSGQRQVASVIALLVAACVPRAAIAQGANCADAMNRVQNAVTSEAYALKSDRQAACELASLPQEARAGKPATIAGAMRKRYEGAMQESLAAFAAARSAGCDVSRIDRPEIVMPPGNYAEYNACELRARSALLEAQMRLDLLDRQGYDASYARYHVSRQSCDRLLEQVDCAAIRIKGDEPPPVVDAPPVVPGDVKPACRAAWLHLDAAEKELQSAQKYVVDIRPHFADAGPKGYEIMKSAMARRDKATQNRYYAKEALRSCEGNGATVEAPKPRPAPTPAGPATPGRAACDATARAAFSAMTGSWKSIAIGPNITIGGSCEEATATEKYAEYCERPDADYNKTLARYEATFTGSMQGASLSLVPAKGSTAKSGGSCSVNGEGTLSCSGLPCGVNAKKN